MTKIFFSPFSFVPVFGSGMGKNQDPGSGINIPDPPHCRGASKTTKKVPIDVQLELSLSGNTNRAV
jgi:hypothetical protein